ncbi:hypothetical protein Tco_1316292 [Tanacetum coccineum]
MGDVNHIRTLGDYSKPSHKGYRNTIELPEGNNVVPLRSDTIRLVQNGWSFHGLRSEDPNQHLKDFLKLVDSLDYHKVITTISSTTMGDANHIRTLGYYSKPSHEGYKNTIELPEGNNVVPLRSDTIQNGWSFHGLRSEDPNQHLKDILKLVESLDLDGLNRGKKRLHLF